MSQLFSENFYLKLSNTRAGSALSSQATVATMPGAIVIEDAASQAVSVADAAGRTVYATSSASDRLEIPAGTGIYLVKVGESVHKVAVR